MILFFSKGPSLRPRLLFSALAFVVVGVGCASPSDETAPASASLEWNAQSFHEETSSTHLWIVDRALDLLEHQGDADRTRAFREMMSSEPCQRAWQQGLLDADFLAAYNDGWSDTKPGDREAKILLSGATWKSHFYDPDTEKNYFDETSPTARTEAEKHLGMGSKAWSSRDTKTACYELGLSLHYMTDVTQPMHAVNFTAISRPFGLHTDFEEYAMTVQDRFVLEATTRVDVSEDASPDSVFVAAAHTSKSLWPATIGAIQANFDEDGKECDRGAFKADKECWQGDPALDVELGKALTEAQKSTARYLYAVAPLFPRR